MTVEQYGCTHWALGTLRNDYGIVYFSMVTGSIFSHQMSNMPYHDGHSGENVA